MKTPKALVDAYIDAIKKIIDLKKRDSDETCEIRTLFLTITLSACSKFIDELGDYMKKTSSDNDQAYNVAKEAQKDLMKISQDIFGKQFNADLYFKKCGALGMILNSFKDPSTSIAYIEAMCFITVK